jgi:hypothetical protein
VAATEVTVPVPVGADHVPSPRQNVEADADVPLFKFVTGRLPVTPVVSGSPVAFVSVPLAGVPNTGAVIVGLVSVLLVKVCVAAIPTKVSVASGSDRVLSTVCVLLSIVRVPVVPPAALNMMRFVASTESCTLT